MNLFPKSVIRFIIASLMVVLWMPSLYAQLSGVVTDQEGTPLPYVNIYLEDSTLGTTSNNNGRYVLELKQPGWYTIVFQFLGYQTMEKQIQINTLPYQLDVSMIPERISLEEVVLNQREDPAYRIIRATIEKRRENLDRFGVYTADFYSRGLWKVDSIPKQIMGQEVGDFGGQLDSTRSGIIYLSETVSKIAYRRPYDFKETITASKVSGNDNGFSFNSAMDANISFYENTIELNTSLVSPIGDAALNYYRYKLEGVFYEENKLINKIKVIPRRPKDKVWSGHVYIVEDDWQLYGLELHTDGDAIQIPFVKQLDFKQNFRYDSNQDAWIKRSQTIEFGFGFLGFEGDGRFIAVYSNYNFKPGFDRDSFDNQVLSFKDGANKKDSLFWNALRPIPLTLTEKEDYVKKDSLQELRKSKRYLDSIDQRDNKFRLLDLLFGYTYRNSFKRWRLSYESPVSKVQFNTVQGWNSQMGLSYFQAFNEERTRYFRGELQAAYGLSDQRLRVNGSLIFNFNRTNRLRLGVFGGSQLLQFNRDNPILPQVNSISSLFFERNYIKLYQLANVGVSWSQELFNGVRTAASVSFEDRSPVYNTTDYVVIPNDGQMYTPNNPSPEFSGHSLLRTTLSTTIDFDLKYFSYPDGKFYVSERKYPTLTLFLENTTAASDSQYEYTHLQAQLFQRLNLGNKGASVYRISGGTFIDGETISFADYRHFNGNQTRVGTSFDYSNNFNLLPYYDLSTNQSYLEGHLEHNFEGWVLGKVPGLNQLNFNLVIGAHLLSTQTAKPYSEYSIGLDNLGWGNFRLLRLDYVRSNYNGAVDGAFIFGLKFLNLLD